MSILDLIKIDLEFCREQNSDLAVLSNEEILNHYATHGYHEGRLVSAHSIRENFIELVKDKSVLEVGPFFSPLLRGPNIKYADVLNQEEMIERSGKVRKPGDSTNVPFIDYVVRDGSLRNIKEKFDAVISSHNIEHQTNPIEHFKEVGNILKDDGAMYVIIPNSRFCMDALLPESKISDLFNAYYDKRITHPIGAVIEHRAMTSHNEAALHWEQPTDPKFTRLDAQRVKQAIAEYEAAKGDYIDVHAWQYSPYSFANIISCLIDLEVIPFSSFEVNGPVKGRNEFTAILKK